MCETLQSSVKMLPLALYMIFYALKYYISLKLELRNTFSWTISTLWVLFNGAPQFFYFYQCLDQFKPVLKKLWFEKYAKRGQYPTSSGFEHTFVGKYSHDILTSSRSSYSHRTWKEFRAWFTFKNKRSSFSTRTMRQVVSFCLIQPVCEKQYPRLPLYVARIFTE